MLCVLKEFRLLPVDEFSNHLIAQVGLEDDEENDILPSIEELKNKKIVCFIQLDEHIIR